MEDISFAGHRKRVSYHDALNNPLFDHDAVLRHQDSESERWAGTDETLDNLGGRWGYRGMDKPKHFEFDSIWLPRQQLIIGLPVEGEPMMLHEPIEWQGVESGPYHILSYDTIPNNILPSPPADSMAYMDDLTNSLMRKIAQDAKNAKTVGLYRPGADKDAARVRDAGNTDMIETMSPDAVQQLTFNGVSSQLLGTFLQTKQLFSWANGGLETLGGLAAGADTARQEQQLLQTAGGMVDEMKAETVTAIGEIVTHIAHYLWRDEMFRPEVPRYIPGVGTIGGKFEVEDREGELDDYRIGIAPYSAAPVTPQSKFQALSTLVLQIVPNLMQLAQAGAIDFERTVKRFARYLDISEVEDVFNMLDTTQMPGMENQPMRDSETTRNYVRESKSGLNPEAQDKQMLSMMQDNAA
jgi:hypothetical protein